MATTESSPFDRFNDALRSLDDQLQELREQFDERRKQFESDVRQRARDLEAQVKDTTLYRRADRVRRQVEDRVDKARAGFYEAIGIASKAELDKISRKLNALSRKLNELAKEQSSRGEADL